MPLAPFAAELIDALSRDPVGCRARNEQALEQEFVIPIAARVGSRHPDVLLFGSLAATKHDVVIGLCGYRGRLDQRWHHDTERVTRWFAGRNVQLVFRSVT
jgi:hypothetical protein